MTRPGGRILVDQLELHGVDLAFGVPGESYLPVLDALHDSPIRLVACRHEVGAANMAEAYGKLTGRPGICIVTRGPGRDARLGRRPHRLPGLDAADPARRPGRAATCSGARPSRSSTTGGCSGRWRSGSAQIDEVERIPELVARAFARRELGPAGAGRARAARGHARRGGRRRRRRALPADPDAPGRRRPRADAASCSQGAARPLVIVGGRPWSAGGARRPRRLLRGERAADRGVVPLPGLRRQRLARLRGPPHARPGPAARARASEDADVLLVVGDRLGEITTARLHAARACRARRRRSSTSTRTRASSAASTSRSSPIVAGPAQFAAALRDVPPLDGAAWREWTRAGARRVPREPRATRRSPATSTWAT